MIFTTNRAADQRVAAAGQNRHSQPDDSRPPLRWIDGTSGLAYLYVRDGLARFGQFLEAVDHLLTHPSWHPGMPIVEDLSPSPSGPPATCVEQWRAYIAEHRLLLEGCRWAVVTREDNATLRSFLDRAAREAVAHGVTLRRFGNMMDAHLWVQRRRLD